ncbi:MAG: hypothetical protein ABSF62_10710 [Bryobacteraceae bacterium]
MAPQVRSSLSQSSVDTVRDLGWSGQRDHVLITGIEGRYDVFLTIDKGFEFQHDLKKLSFGIIVLTTANNQMPSYERLLDELVRQIQHVSPGQLVHVIDPDCAQDPA